MAGGGGGGHYRLCWPTGAAGTGPGVVATGGRRVIAGRPVLSFRRIICLVAAVRLAVPPAAERQPDGRYRRRGSHHGRTGAGRQRTLPAEREAIDPRGTDPPGHSA